MSEITEQEKDIYNTYLRVSRTTQDKPFRYRKDFSDFPAEDLYHLKRICVFLNKFPQIRTEYYFKAPFMLYRDQTYFGLDYFSGMAAIKCYSTFMKELREKDPDCEEQLTMIADSLKFIARFCSEKNIPLNKYCVNTTGSTYDWMKHVKNNYVSLYSLMEFKNIFELIMEVAEDERLLFLGDEDIKDKFHAYKDRYLKSEKAKLLVKQGLTKIDQVIENSIKSRNNANVT